MNLFLLGSETLGYMLLGMAALKSGFLTGDWDKGAYRRTVLIGLGVGVPAYAVMTWLLVASDFSVSMVLATTMAASVVFRPAMIYAYAALIILRSEEQTSELQPLMRN